MLSKSVWVWTLPFKKEVEFPAVFTKNSCGIFMGLGFWLWNLHKRISSRVFFQKKYVYIYIYIYIYIFNAPVWCFPGIALHGECLAYPLPDYQDQAYLDWFSADVLYTVISQGNLQIGWCCLYWWILHIY